MSENRDLSGKPDPEQGPRAPRPRGDRFGFRRAVLAAVLCLAASAAPAQTGRGLTPDFEGRWIAIGAEPAPWSRAGNRPGAARPAVPASLVFRRDAILGSAPFACTAPSYSVLLVPPQGLFQGGLGQGAGRDAADDADRLGFAEGPVRTLRADCRNASFDYHLAGPTTLKVALDNMIHTFERPR